MIRARWVALREWLLWNAPDWVIVRIWAPVFDRREERMFRAARKRSMEAHPAGKGR